MKKFFSIAVIAVIVAMLLGITCFAADEKPSITICLVYDDSGSMIDDGPYGAPHFVDTWCQAKYALEVFTSMLGEKDVLHVFHMSNGGASDPTYSLYGSDNVKDNISIVHNRDSGNSGTPFATVESANNYLKNCDGDIKWLVVLTDGAFLGRTADELPEYFKGEDIAEGTNVYFIGMGENAPDLTSEAEGGFHAGKAEQSSDILDELTKTCRYIFQNNPLTITDNTVTVNISMEEIVVFVQGSSLGKPTLSKDGKTYLCDDNIAEVTSTDIPYAGCIDPVVKADLNGVVATFKGDFAPGTYAVNADGASSVAVYYRPKVAVQAVLMDALGNEIEIDENTKLVPGKYSVEFYFLDMGESIDEDKRRITDTTLLGDTVFDAVYTSGNNVNSSVRSGDVIELVEGSFSLNVKGRFLEYNTREDDINLTIYSDRQITVNYNADESKSTFRYDDGKCLNPKDALVFELALYDDFGTYELSEGEDRKVNVTLIKNDGVDFNQLVSDGRIYLTPKNATVADGEYTVGVKVSYNGKSAEDAATYTVKSSKVIVFDIEAPDYTVDKTGFIGQDKIKITVLGTKNSDGTIKELDENELKAMGKPEVSEDSELDGFDITEGSNPGEFLLMPRFKNNDPFTIDSCTVKITVKDAFTYASEDYYGNASETFTLTSNISFIDVVAKHWIEILISIIILLLILGYIPPFKKYLPKKIKKRPHIDCSSNKIGHNDAVAHGKFKKSFASTLIPYKAETGVISFSPPPVRKSIRVKAAGGNGMYIMNYRQYAGKTEVTFNGISVEQNRNKPLRIGANATITLNTPEFTYTCYLTR